MSIVVHEKQYSLWKACTHFISDNHITCYSFNFLKKIPILCYLVNFLCKKSHIYRIVEESNSNNVKKIIKFPHSGCIIYNENIQVNYKISTRLLRYVQGNLNYLSIIKKYIFHVMKI